MKITNLLRRLRGKITGLNVISARFDSLQAQLNRILTVVAQTYQVGRALPGNEKLKADAETVSPIPSTSLIRESINSCDELDTQVNANTRSFASIECINVFF